ncbi:FliO/MopB family protein [Tepidicaulis sp.]|uniref:FliO/MopB family protein n=1 Tax=Tepidicaulis sp. TaxID=1920809 RepID=UPI003B5B213C
MDLAEYTRFLGALLLVLAMIGGCAWLARRFGLMQHGLTNGPASRLAIVEKLTLDPKHKLLLIRRDGKEHLIVVGETTTLIEAGLDAPAPAETGAEAETVNVASFPGFAASTPAAQPAHAKMTAPDFLLKGIAYLKERRT